jgi:DNA-binding FadR family transcriptional regulator
MIIMRPHSYHSGLVDRLGRLVVAGALGVDGTLPREAELAQRFGVSRTVVREASKTLQALGLISTGPRVGSRVQPLDQWRLLDPQVLQWITDADLAGTLERDLLELRVMIEPVAAAHAAERGSDAQIARILAALAAMAEAPDKQAHEAADYDFHDAVLTASGNRLLAQLNPILRAVLKASFRLSMHDHARAQASVAIHRNVARAIAARDPAAARKAMTALLDVAQADMARARACPPAAMPATRNATAAEEGHHARASGKMDITRA